MSPYQGPLRALLHAPSADNSQPWQIRLDGTLAECSYRHRAVGPDIFGPTGHASLMAGGALHESLAALSAASASSVEPDHRIGLGEWWIEGHVQRSDATSRVEANLLSRHTNRHPFRGPNVEWHPKPGIRTFGVEASLRSGPDVGALAESVRLASSVRFRSRDLHEWLFSSIRWTPEEASRGDGLDIATLHLPPGGRHFMKFIAPWPRMEMFNRFGLYRVMAAIDSKLIAEAPAIVAIRGGNSPGQVWEAGRVMLDTWVSLNAAGYAVHPYYVITDIWNRLEGGAISADCRADAERAVAMTREVLDLQPDERLHILFRVGRPTRTPVRSRRLPIEQLMA